jgi:hypothetical protein
MSLTQWGGDMIRDLDFYHGAALTKIAEHPSFKALNKGSQRYGHYLINADCHLFIKYAKNAKGPWQFTFREEHLDGFRNASAANADVYVALVCGTETICLLREDDVRQLVDVDSSHDQWVKVDAPPNKGCRVSGPGATLKRKISRNAFPTELFETT